MNETGLRARKKARKKAELLAITTRLVGTDFTMEEVAAEADVSLRTIWRYFEGGKTELILDALEVTLGMPVLPSAKVAKVLRADPELRAAAWERIHGGDPDRMEQAAKVLAEAFRT